MLCTAERALRSRLYRIRLYRRQAMAVPLDCSGLGVVRCSRTGRPRLMVSGILILHRFPQTQIGLSRVRGWVPGGYPPQSMWP